MIPLFKVFMADSVGDAVNEVLYSGFIGEGPKVIDFEEKLKSSFKNLVASERTFTTFAVCLF